MRSSPLNDQRVEDVLRRLLAASRTQMRSLLWHYLPKLPRLLMGGRIDWQHDSAFYRDKYIALDQDQGELIYVLARAIKAQRIVEFGTSFGISTLFLAAAVRDNGGGIVIGSEMEPSKVIAARSNFAEAGLSEWIDLREGDALQSLRDPGGPIDLLLLDGWPAYNAQVLKLLVPHLRNGALIIADNAGGPFKAEMKPCLDYLRDAANDFRLTVIGLKAGMVIAVRDMTQRQVEQAVS